MHNILFYYPFSQVNTGSPQVLLRIISGLDRKRFTPFFLAAANGELSTEIEKVKGQVIRGSADSISRLSLFQSCWNILKLIKLLSRNKISLVHFNDLGWNYDLAVAAWLKRIPILFHIHNQEKLSKWDINCILGSRYLFVSRKLLEDCKGTELLGNRAIVLHNPIPVNSFAKGHAIRTQLGVPNEARVIGTVAQISRRKGIDLVIETAKIILESFPDAYFLIIGPDGKGEKEFAQEMRRRASVIASGQRILFLGPRKDIRDILASLDLFFLPSRSEPFGMAICEAMAAGVPVVASNVGGIPEIIPDDSYGVLKPPNAEELSSSIIAILTDEQRRREIKKNAFERVGTKFSEEKFNNQLMEIYDSFLQKKRR